MDADADNAAQHAVSGLAHVAIRAADLRATVAFYRRALGLVEAPRPPFGFPGAWLGVPGGEALVHLYGGERPRGPDGAPARGGGAVDHVSLWARGHEAQRARFESLGLPYGSQRVPATGLAQLFVYDPNGVLLELTYRLADEPGAVVGERGGAPKFEPACYRQFAAPAAVTSPSA
jgi:catechol 2,3-dioxygenase-like lactoylglutathione lyase family enzyme